MNHRPDFAVEPLEQLSVAEAAAVVADGVAVNGLNYGLPVGFFFFKLRGVFFFFK